MEMMNNQVNEAQRKTLKDSDKVYDVGKGVGQLDITHHIRKKLDISGKGMDTVYFDSSTLVYGDKTVVRRALVNKRLTVGDLVKEVEKFISKNGRNKPTYESVERAAWVPESIADEQVEAFMEATVAAVAEGKDTFVFEAKHYKAKSKKEDKLDPVGKEDDDVDNDGDVDSSDKYLKKRRAAIKKSMNEAEEMDPTKHVSKKGDMYCVYNKEGEEVAKFDNEEEANTYARKNHDALMGKEESAEENYTDKQDASYREPPVKSLKRLKQRRAAEKGKKRPDPLRNTKPLKFESVEEAAAPGSTAQHGPDAATSDTFKKQMGGGRSPGEKEFVDMHKTEIGLDIEKVTAQNKQSMEDALKQTPPRMGDQKTGDTSFVNPVKAEIIDGITKALQQMKTNS
jgi:hypothetical protein